MSHIGITAVLGVITVLAIIFIPLITSHLERKQLRQIELYKQDPQLHPLKPPPNIFVRWIGKYWFYLFGLADIGVDMVDVYYHVHLPDPPSHHDVFSIALSITMIFAWVLFLVVNWFLDRLLRVLEKSSKPQ